MTRINCIPVEDLMDQHLLAEYRELPMIGASLNRSRKAKSFHYSDSKEYVLNKGHVRFFYDKGGFLKKRYAEIKAELVNRGFNLSEDREDNFGYFLESEMNDWVPTEEDKAVSLERINERVSQKPEWYRYYGKVVDSKIGEIEYV